MGPIEAAMTMNVRQQIREELRKELEGLKIFKSVHKDKWQPMTEDEVPACRVELTTETVERLDETDLSQRTAQVQVICYVADPGGTGEVGEPYADAIDGAFSLNPPMANLLQGFWLDSIDFDSASEAEDELVTVTLTYSASWNWRPDPPDLGPLEIIHADIDCAVGDPPGPDGKIEASTTVNLKE